MALRGRVFADGTVTLLRDMPHYEREQEWALTLAESDDLRRLLGCSSGAPVSGEAFLEEAKQGRWRWHCSIPPCREAKGRFQDFEHDALRGFAVHFDNHHQTPGPRRPVPRLSIVRGGSNPSKLAGGARRG